MIYSQNLTVTTSAVDVTRPGVMQSCKQHQLIFSGDNISLTYTINDTDFTQAALEAGSHNIELGNIEKFTLTSAGTSTAIIQGY
ncbi:hypothetical protein ACRN9C_03515 [Shewanella frigidimarina]|uniref:hypothetical protein n=1 Tax=Shewanella frigidimarina TaxID=56812 RepID=UPI003D7ACA30